MRLSSNITALTISTQMKKTNRYATASSLKLSSGVKINSAKDDPAGSAIINRLSTKISIAGKNSENYQDGISLLQTVDSAVGAMGDMLQRMRELAVNSATGTLTDEDREKIDVEVEQLQAQINAMSKERAFNGINFMNGDSTRLTYPSAISGVNPTYNYVSGNVPEGLLEYDVISYGEPANVPLPALSALVASPNSTALADGNIYINGYDVAVQAGDTFSSIVDKIKTACDASNLIYFDDKLITKDEGKDATITINAVPDDFLGLGFTDIDPSDPLMPSATGKDAVIDLSSVKMYQLPDGTVPIQSFNSGLSVQIDGNYVSFVGTNNQLIEMALDFEVDPTTGAYNQGSTGIEQSKILDSGQLKIQAGDNKASALSLYFRKLNTETLRIDNVNLGTQEGSNKAIADLDRALASILSYRAEIGAYQNRLETAASSLDDASVNMQTYMSTIRDTDVAYEMSYYSNQNVKMQAAMSVLAQANQRPQQILQLLG